MSAPDLFLVGIPPHRLNFGLVPTQFGPGSSSNIASPVDLDFNLTTTVESRLQLLTSGIMASSSSSHAAESESGNANRASPPQDLIDQFPWVTREVLSYRSKLTMEDLEGLPVRDTNTYSLCLPEEEEPVCSVREGSHNSFFFFYADYITRLGIRFPFSEFQMATLQFLSIAPRNYTPMDGGNFFKVVAKTGTTPWFLKGPDSPKVDWEFNLYWCQDHHNVSPSAYKVERSNLLKPERKAIDAILDHVRANGIVGAGSLVAQYRAEARRQDEMASWPNERASIPFSGSPSLAAKGRKRSAKELGKSKVGESSRRAEPKRPKVGSRPSPEPKSTVSPIRASPSRNRRFLSRPTSSPRPCLDTRFPSSFHRHSRSHLWSIGKCFLERSWFDRSFLTPHHKYAEAATELKRARTDRDEALKQWQVASNEFQVEKVEFRLKETEGLLADSNVIIEGFKAAQARSEEQLKAMTAERDGFRAEVDRIKAEGEASSTHLSAEITRLQELLLGSVVEPFENSLAQIRALNPGIELNTTGHHFRSYVTEGQIVPYVEPPAGSETRIDGDAAVLEAEQGEEVSTAPKHTD
ncbi:hypothetical protein K1719_008249 [Acacia pycnantha]|nr:hypothetical protein K1719_008249 [Acacia pycnantha]